MLCSFCVTGWFLGVWSNFVLTTCTGAQQVVDFGALVSTALGTLIRWAELAGPRASRSPGDPLVRHSLLHVVSLVFVGGRPQGRARTIWGPLPSHARLAGFV